MGIKNKLQAYTSKSYLVNYYKNSDIIGIKKKGGGQLFSFGNKKELGEERLRAWADDVLKELDKGMSPINAKKWFHERLA